jgi:hypothetical protein
LLPQDQFSFAANLVADIVCSDSCMCYLPIVLAFE